MTDEVEETLEEIQEREARIEERIKRLPFDEAFPEPDYNALLRWGVPPIRVALAHALRDEIGPKPHLPRNEYDDEGLSAPDLRAALEDYAKEVRETKELSDWVLSEEKMPAEAIKAACAWRDKGETPILDIDEIDVDESEKDNVFSIAKADKVDISGFWARTKLSGIYGKAAFYVLGGISDVTLRMNLYMRYGHGVSFKGVRLSFWSNRIDVVKNDDYSDVLATLPHYHWPTEDKYFSPQALNKLVNDSAIRQWRNDQARKQEERETPAKEAEKQEERGETVKIEKKEVFEEDCDNDYSAGY